MKQRLLGLAVSLAVAACASNSGTEPGLSCADHPSLCGENAACEGTTCRCVGGYTGDGQHCTDVDECADGSSGCTNGCTNMPGGYACGMDTFTTVAAGEHSGCGVMTNHALACWGTAILESSAQFLTPLAATTPGAVGVADDHVCAIDPAGALACTAAATDAVPDLTFAQVGTATYLQVAAAHGRTCAIDTDHALWCWETAGAGPARVGTATWTQIAVSPVHACGIQTDGTLWCWGDNTNDQLGTQTAASATPLLVDAHADWTAISTSAAVTCGVRGGDTTNGSGWCWGGTHLPTGGPSTSDTGWSTPEPITLTQLTGISVGATVGCATTIDGLYCWGDDDHAQLGDGGPASHENGPQRIVHAAGFHAVATGDELGCAVDGAGVLTCWGSTVGGAVGDGEVPGTYGVLQPIAASVNGWSNVAMLDDSACAIDGAGILACWGKHGNGDARHFGEPWAVDGSTPWRAVGVLLGGACGAHAADGSLWCWDAKDAVHQLGAVSGFTTIGSGVADTHACGLVGGALYCWGKNTYGELGLGTIDDPDTVTKHGPTRVGTDEDWTAVVPHAFPAPHTCGLRGGALYCWGSGYGAAPVQIGGDSDWTYLEPVTGDAGLRGGTEYAWTQATLPAQTASALTTWKVKLAGAGIAADGLIRRDDGTALSTEAFTSLGAQGTGDALELCGSSTAGGLWCFGAADLGADGELGNGAAWQATPVAIFVGVPL